MTRDVFLRIRFTSEERAELHAAVRAAGYPETSPFIREAVKAHLARLQQPQGQSEQPLPDHPEA